MPQARSMSTPNASSPDMLQCTCISATLTCCLAAFCMAFKRARNIIELSDSETLNVLFAKSMLVKREALQESKRHLRVCITNSVLEIALTHNQLSAPKPHLLRRPLRFLQSRIGMQIHSMEVNFDPLAKDMVYKYG